jgi:hypothetical protein
MIKLSQILLTGGAALGLTSAAAAQPNVVDLETALRCSAAFGIAASEQARGVGTARTDYPALDQRGREFFVQTGARLMDAQKLDRPALQRRLQAEVAKLQTEVAAAADPAARFKAIMTPCLAVLDLTVPLRR